MIAFIVFGAVIATTIALISPVSAADAPKKTVDSPFSEDNRIDSQKTATRLVRPRRVRNPG
jgi:hypothetical protein